MAGPVERVDRRGHRHPEPARDLPGVALLQEGEVAVDPVQLLPQRRAAALARAGEVAVDMPRGQPPWRQPVVLAQLHHRPDQPVQGAGGQPGDVPRPLVLGQRVDEEAVLVAGGDLGGSSALQGDDIGQTRLARQLRGQLAPVWLDGRRGDEGQRTTLGIRHGAADYTTNSQIPNRTPRILDGSADLWSAALTT
ncbi:MAG TPA: hypothetical protein VE776_10255 [Actinomycetota bacterium]|nr:hypothetical protein [Actinomycetota bacterium]